MSSLKQTALINIFFRYVQLFFSLVSGIILVPFYLRYVSSELYGAWIATSGIVLWLTIVDPGISNILIQKVAWAYGKHDYDKVSRYTSAGLTLTFLLGIFIAFAAYLTKSFVPALLNMQHCSPHLLERAFILTAFSSATMVVAYSIIAINYALQASLSIGIVYTSSQIAKIVFTIVLLQSGYGIISLPLGDLICSFMILSLNIFILASGMKRKNISICLSFGRNTDLFSLFGFTFGERISKALSRNVDIFFIARFLGPTAAAQFSLTSRAIRFGENLINYPIAAFRPTISHLAGSGDAFKLKLVTLRLVRIIIWSSGLLLTGFLCFNDDFVVLWVGPSLYAGAYTNILLCFSSFIFMVNNSLGAICFSRGNIKGISIAEFFQTLFTVPLLFFCTKYAGLPGAAGATIFAICATTMWYIPKSFYKLLDIKLDEGKSLAYEILSTAIVSIITVLCFSFISPKDWLTYIILVALMTLTYVLLLWLASKALRIEINEIRLPCFRKLARVLSLNK